MVDDALAPALLLTGAGGFLDAYAYLCRGGVFANAQTGNVVLLGVHLAAGDWERGLRHVPPILAFFAGATLVHALLLRDRRRLRLAAVLCLSCEAAGLASLALLGPVVPDVVATAVISLLAAIQSASFATVRGWSYNTAMTTGNLRSLAGALGATIVGIESRRNLSGMAVLGLVCLAFLAGAAAGGAGSRIMADRALLVPALVVAGIAAWLCFRPPPA